MSKELNINDLLDKYCNGMCTPQEKAEVENWYNYLARTSRLEDVLAELEQSYSHLINKPRHQIFNLKRVLAAAVFTGIIGSSILYLVNNQNNIQRQTNEKLLASLLASGKPVLKLSSGKVIDLTAAKDGKLAISSGCKIAKAEGNKILYSYLSEVPEDSKPGVDQLIVPAGYDYQVSLGDGSTINLNANTTLTYDPLLSGKERSVEVNGEAYFAIAKNADKPFTVRTSGQIVEVLGTHFNVSAYSNEPTLTTVTEGLVAVSVKNNTSGSKERLKQGQQSIVINDKITVNETDTSAVVAWKNGLFFFEKTPLRDALNQIGKWYKIEIDYNSIASPEKPISGTLKRNLSLDRIIAALTTISGIEFIISEGKITAQQPS